MSGFRNKLCGPIFILLALVFVSCGVKAPPQPARFMLPAAVRNLKYHFNEEGLLVISFKPPIKNLLSKPLKGLGGFIIDRSENQLTQSFCPGCPVTYTSRITIPIDKAEDIQMALNREYTHTEKLSPGNVYHYRVFAQDRKGRFDRAKSRSLVIFYDSPSRQPDTVHAIAGDRRISLTWPPPDRLVDGRVLTELAGYDIYRRTGETPWVKLNADRPWIRPAFDDHQVVNQRTYYYRITALRRWHGTWIESASTSIVAAKPVDLTPPAPPVTLEAASVPEGISLRWQPVESSDLAGYRVYRRAEGEPEFKLIGPKLVKKSVYIDKQAARGRLYFFRVTAVDNAAASNESQPSQEKAWRHAP